MKASIRQDRWNAFLRECPLIARVVIMVAAMFVFAFFCLLGADMASAAFIAAGWGRL